MDDPVRVGGRLRKTRVAKGLSLRELAYPGCSAGYLSLVERGKRTPSLQVIVGLAERLGVDPAYLARGNGNTRGAPSRKPVIELYLRSFGLARTREERVWVLAGLAQAAAAGGELVLAASALRRALMYLPGG